MLEVTRANSLTDALMAEPEKLKELYQKAPIEVVEYLKGKGYDFTEEEVKEYGLELEAAVKNSNGELSENDLDGVAGGKGEFRTGVVIGMLIGIACGGW